MNDQTMQAFVLEDFQQNLQLKEVPTPTAQKGQVLVQIKASGVNPLDLKIKAGQAAHAKVWGTVAPEDATLLEEMGGIPFAHWFA